MKKSEWFFMITWFNWSLTGFSYFAFGNDAVIMLVSFFYVQNGRTFLHILLFSFAPTIPIPSPLWSDCLFTILHRIHPIIVFSTAEYLFILHQHHGQDSTCHKTSPRTKTTANGNHILCLPFHTTLIKTKLHGQYVGNNTITLATSSAVTQLESCYERV